MLWGVFSLCDALCTAVFLAAFHDQDSRPFPAPEIHFFPISALSIFHYVASSLPLIVHFVLSVLGDLLGIHNDLFF